MAPSCRKMSCVFGSVTGKAQSIAEQIVDTASSKGIKIDLYSFESFGKLWDLADLEVAILVSSTTGDGEQPEALTKFWRRLRPKQLAPNYLASLSYTILGLGDSNYNQFCNAPKNLHRRLAELGGQEFYPPGWADDGVGLELVVEPWLEGLWPVLFRLLGRDQQPPAEDQEVKCPPSTHQTINTSLSPMEPGENLLDSSSGSLRFSPQLATTVLDLPHRPPDFLAVTWLDKDPAPASYQNGAKLPLADGPVIVATVVGNKTLSRPGAVKSYKQMDVSLGETQLDCLPGDTIGVLCSNPAGEVEELALLLGLSDRLDQPLAITVLADTRKARAKVPDFLPREGRLRDLLTNCLDLRSVPKKLLIRVLVDHTTDVRETRRLEELCSKQGADEYMHYIRANQVSLADLLKVFSSCRPPLSLLLEHLPRLLPRPYSISSRQAHPTLSFVYTVVEMPRPGLTTAWLAGLDPLSSARPEIRLFLRQGRSFRPPALADSLVMVCAGSGIGPFYGFLRHWEEERKLYRGPLGQAWLIFGCRSRQLDYLFEEELKQLAEYGVLSRLTVCFSRDPTGVKDGPGSGGDMASIEKVSVDTEKVTSDRFATKNGSGDDDDDAAAKGERRNGKYVQHGMIEAGEELAVWILEKGARFYVCGDAANMGRSVQEALVQVLDRHGGQLLGAEGSAEYVTRMVAEKRYLQDVWT